MNNVEIEQSIAKALENTSANNFESIKKAAQESKGVVVPMKNKTWIKIVAVVAAFAIVFGGGFGIVSHQVAKNKVVTTVTLDVNPSIELSLNKFDEILGVKDLNTDGASVLEGLDLTGLDINDGIEKIISSMTTNGYLSDVQNSILVTVESQKDKLATQLQETLTSQIEEQIKNNLSIDGNVISQIISSSTDTTNLEKLAEQYGISLGKANFLDQIIGSTEGLNMEDLASKTINELSLIATAKGAELAETIVQQGTASVQKYIDENAAQLIALATENITSLDISGLEITKSNFTYNNGAMCYDIGFNYKNEAFLIEVDASTGAIIDKETGKIGVELTIKDVNVEVNTGNEAVDKAVNAAAKDVIDNNVNGKTVSGSAEAKSVKTNDDGSITAKGEVELGGQTQEVEITLDEATVNQIKTTAKSAAKAPIKAALSGVGVTLPDAIVDSVIDKAIDNATVDTVDVDGTPCYKVSTSILSINADIYLTKDLQFKNVEIK